MDTQGDVAPENLVTLVYTQGDPTLSIEINAKEFDGEAPSIIPLYIEAKIADYYPLVASLKNYFNLEVKDPCRSA